MKPACPRLFEAEALRDGRLKGAEEARFRAHLAQCGACAAETQSFRKLADALRASSGDADELHVRRERTRLLAAFDASLTPAPARHGWRWAAAAMALVAALAFVVQRSESKAPPIAAPTPVVSEPVSVRADSSARWSRRTESKVETITLERGALSIRVDHATRAAEQRLLVRLPDGELEDLGTTFSVSVDGGKTTRVHVEEGSVVLRLRDRPAIALGAGDAWSPPAPPAMAESATAPRPKPVPKAPELDPAADFRTAMSALSGGEAARAAGLFAQFLAQHPRDSRAEDAAYLRVVALQRTGNPAAMQQAAGEYLARYPHGFRRSEIEALAH